MFELSNNRILKCVFERISAIMRYDMGVGCGLVIPLSRSLVRKVRGCDIDYILARLSTFASAATVESRANPTTFTPSMYCVKGESEKTLLGSGLRLQTRIARTYSAARLGVQGSGLP